MITVHKLTEINRWDSICEEWNRLAHGVFTRRYEWLRAWWDAYGGSHPLSILIAEENERIIGIFPLYQSDSFLTGVTLRWLGSGKACSDNMSILCEPQDRDRVAQVFSRFLFDSFLPSEKWDHLDLDGIQPSCETMQSFWNHWEQLGRTHAEKRASPACWSVELPESLELYLASLSKRARKILRNCERAYATTSTFEVAKSADQAMEFLVEIKTLHQARWERRGITGCFATESFSNFLQFSIERHFRQPSSLHGDCQVHVARVKIQNKTAAGAICFEHNRVLSIYLVGMNPELESERPGWQNSYGCIRHAFQLGCKKVDFMRGDEEYKQRLGATSTEQERWIVASPRMSSVLRNQVYRTAIAIKNWTQQFSRRSESEKATTESD